MQKVISINLNGNAFQLDESGYELLRDYLARAERELEGSPDRAEILADLEQAIADKCQKYLATYKTVVRADEIKAIVEEMGPVTSPSGEPQGGGGGGTAAASGAAQAGGRPRRLYRVTDGAMIAGVCAGVAEYFQVDVTWIRIAFVAGAFLTQGIGILVYVAMMFVVPEASTPEERAAAGGLPFNAREVVDRVKRQYAEGTRQFGKEFRRHRRQWRAEHRRWRYSMPWSRMPAVYGPPPPWAPLLPVFGLMHLTLFVLMAAMMISLVNTGGILTWRLPADVPVWAGALVLLVGYQIVVAPIRAVEQWGWRVPGVEPGWFAFWHAVVWLSGLAVVTWIASSHIPEIAEFVRRLPPLFQDFAQAVKQFWNEQFVNQ